MTSASGEKQHCVHDPQCCLLREFVASGQDRWKTLGVEFVTSPVLQDVISTLTCSYCPYTLTCIYINGWGAYRIVMQECYSYRSRNSGACRDQVAMSNLERICKRCMSSVTHDIAKRRFFFQPRTSHHLIELKIGRIPEHWHFAFEALIG